MGVLMYAPNLRQGVIILKEAKADDAPPGTCRWCGEKLVGKRLTIRRYCYLKYEGRDCKTPFLESRVWKPRVALIRAARWAGKTELRCADCGFVVAKIHPRGATEWSGVRPWQADHEIPIVDGGPHTLANLWVRCVPCHSAKTAREARARAILHR